MFYSPWYLLLLLLVPILGWRMWSSSRGLAVPFSSTYFAPDCDQLGANG